MKLKGVNHKNKASSKIANTSCAKNDSPCEDNNLAVMDKSTETNSKNNILHSNQLHVPSLTRISTSNQVHAIVISQPINKPNVFVCQKPIAQENVVQADGLLNKSSQIKQVIHFVQEPAIMKITSTTTQPKQHQSEIRQEPIIDPSIQIAPEIIEFVQQDKKAYSCSHCRYQSDTEEELNSHFQNEHEKIKNITCDLCSYITWNKYNLRRHVQNCHSEKGEKLDMPVLEMKCPQCSYQFSIRDKESRAQSRLNRHIQEVHGSVKDIQCTLCNYQTKRKSNLEAHMTRIHAKRKDGGKQTEAASHVPFSQMSTNIIQLNRQNDVISVKKWDDATFVTPENTYFMQ